MMTASATAGATPAVSVRPVSVMPSGLLSREATPQPAEQSALVPFSRDLQQLVTLNEDWDSYGAAAPHRAALEVAWRIASKLCEVGPAPQVFPTRRGGVQLEWHRPNTRLEWEIDPDGSTGVFVFDNQSSGQSLDGELPAQMPDLVRALSQVLVDR
jgi:hypothetical protein